MDPSEIALRDIHPLDAAVSCAFEHLRPGGVLLLDDFDRGGG
jgi:hypothetical protein